MIKSLRRITSTVCIVIGTIAPSLQASGTPPVIVGTLYDEQRLPARNADICFYRADYQPVDAAAKPSYPQGAIRCRSTDRSGMYELQLPDRATYLLLARKKNSWVMRTVTPTLTGDTIRCFDTLRPTGSLQFSVEAEGMNNHRAKLGLTGTPFTFTSDSAGIVTIKKCTGRHLRGDY